eukprot:c23523_g1_i1 orf=121-1611(+)
MNFLKSSFFADLKLPDILSQPHSPPTPASQAPQVEAASSSNAEIGWEQHWMSEDEADPLYDGQARGSDMENLADVEQAVKFEGQTSGAWNIGSLVKSLTLKSEEVLNAYKRDLQEFSSGLKKETVGIAEVAAHAMKDLPNSLEVGASVAQDSLETVGQAIEELGSTVWRGTAEIIAQGKEAVLSVNDDDSTVASGGVSNYASTQMMSGKYSRFDVQVRSMQNDSNTYCVQPEDEGDYRVWQSTFLLEDREEEIHSILQDNSFVEELHLRVVPSIVDHDTFWTRYFYRLHKLRQVEEARADLVKRAAASEEEDLSWDSDDEIVEEVINATEKREEQVEDRNEDVTKVVEMEEKPIEDDRAKNVHANSGFVNDVAETSDDKSAIKTSDLEDKMGMLVEQAMPKSTNSPKVEEEEDLGWEVAEDIEDSSSNEGKKSSNSETSWEVPECAKADIKKSSNSETSWEVPECAKADIKKRFKSVEEEEDLSWDVDDEDDDVKP